MKKKIRVCEVVHGIVGGGSEQVILNYCSRMPNIHFDLLYQYEPNPLILERFNDIGINCIRIPDKVHHPVKHLWTMYQIFRKGNFDVVHSHLDWYMNVTAMFCAWLAGVKKRVAHHHQAYHPSTPLLKILCVVLRIPNKIFATHWLACGKVAAINGWGRAAVEKGKVVILPNAVDSERFKFNITKRSETRKSYQISENDFVVGHIGRFYPEKNHIFLIDIFENLVKTKPNAKLLLVGNGPLQERVKNIVKEKNLVDLVIFAGLQKDTVPFYSAMDVLLLPSIREAFPMTLMEAQYNGLPCIVSEAVPRETNISNNVSFLSLREPQFWVDHIVRTKIRNSPEFEIINDQFNLEKCRETLRSIYLDS